MGTANYLVQRNIWAEHDYDRFLASMENLGQPMQEVNVVPFTEEFDEPVTIEPDYVFGSSRFVQICRLRGYPTFRSFAPLETHYPAEFWVNGPEGYTTTWGELVERGPADYPAFLKPYTEKFFTGRVVEQRSDLAGIQLSTSFIADENAERIRVSPAVTIHDEVRAFVIGGEIITASYYRMARRARHQAIRGPSDPMDCLHNLLRQFGAIERAFAIDLGRTDSGWKIVELNNLNSAGIYQCDTDALVRTLSHFK